MRGPLNHAHEDVAATFTVGFSALLAWLHQVFIGSSTRPSLLDVLRQRVVITIVSSALLLLGGLLVAAGTAAYLFSR